MRRIRFHIGTLVILVLLLGVGLAALRESDEIWDSGILSVTLGLLLISILLAIHRAEKQRAFWIGFALFGSIYLALSLVPSIESRLMTTKALTYLDSKVQRPSALLSYNVALDTIISSGTGNNQVSNGTYTWGGSQPVTVQLDQAGGFYVGKGKLLGAGSGTTEGFIKIGHSLCALLLGWLGGQASRLLYRES